MSTKTLAKTVGLAKFATGSYTGDGAASQSIVGVGFQPTVVILYANITGVDTPAFKTDQDGDFTYLLDSAVGFRWQTDMIISLDADGFTVGDGTPLAINMCNVAARGYTYVCFGR